MDIKTDKKNMELALFGGKKTRDHFLSFFRHSIDENEIEEIVDTLKSDWITTGPKTQQFEELFRNYIGSKNAISVSSCTAGLHLSLVALNIKAKSEIITTPFTFAATANVIEHIGCQPVFVDIDPATFNLDPEKIEENITKRTKAIIPVHYAGHPCDMGEITKIASDHDLHIIEDAAHAMGATYHHTKIGNSGNLTSFSFYATKNLTTAEGGMVTTNDEKLAEKLRILRLHGISRDAWKRYSSEGSWKYEILCPGYKCNMTDIQASMGIQQLKKFDLMQKKRGKIVEKYNIAFKNIPQIVIPKVKKGIGHGLHLYTILLNTEYLSTGRDTIIEAFKAENIGTSVHFIPIHLHPYYREKYHYRDGDFPIAENVYNRIISLPLFPSMSEQDTTDVIGATTKILNYFRR
jgi:dTDP-4-amino-4,6-dideoxygalactose transaminase